MARDLVELEAELERGLQNVTDKRIWFITGAGRGMGVDIATAALAAGHAGALFAWMQRSGTSGGNIAKWPAGFGRVAIDHTSPGLRIPN